VRKATVRPVCEAWIGDERCAVLPELDEPSIGKAEFRRHTEPAVEAVTSGGGGGQQRRRPLGIDNRGSGESGSARAVRYAPV
jgi:hypothetical protein